MGRVSYIRAIEASERRQVREAQRHQRELARRAQELAKLSEQEQARLEVDSFENQLELLLSVHKEQSEAWDWEAFIAALPPPPPQRARHNERKARQRLAVLLRSEKEAAEAEIEQAIAQDEQKFSDAVQAFQDETAELDRMRALAKRILAGEHKAYSEVLAELSPFAEISNLGSAIQFTVHSAKVVECALKVNGKQAIPAETKTLTATGKVSTKPMAKKKFHDVYQDYLCGCLLRVARETFALLPVETVLLTATVDSIESRSGRAMELPVLSVVIHREAMSKLDFDQLDPSDAIESFMHRGDFKASRKTETFQHIQPITFNDISPAPAGQESTTELLVNARSLCIKLKDIRLALGSKAQIT
jgi:hypothetical protein